MDETFDTRYNKTLHATKAGDDGLSACLLSPALPTTCLCQTVQRLQREAFDVLLQQRLADAAKGDEHHRDELVLSHLAIHIAHIGDSKTQH